MSVVYYLLMLLCFSICISSLRNKENFLFHQLVCPYPVSHGDCEIATDFFDTTNKVICNLNRKHKHHPSPFN